MNSYRPKLQTVFALKNSGSDIFRKLTSICLHGWARYIRRTANQNIEPEQADIQVCANCSHFYPERNLRKQFENGDVNLKTDPNLKGECRLNPPTSVPGYYEGRVDWMQPEVAGMTWCSKWQAKNSVGASDNRA